MIKNRFAALIYRLFCLLFTLVGLLVHMDILNGNLNLRMFMYYTIQSNLLALAMFAILTAKTIRDIRKNGKLGPAGYYPRFEMVCCIDLLLTLIVYWVMLAPGAFSMGTETGLFSFDNLAVHLVVPLLCILDYFLFTTPGHLKYRDVYYVLIYPLFYVLFTTVAGLMGYVYRISSIDGRPVRFPYFFFDWDDVGAKGFLYILVLVAFFLLLSHLLYWLDKKRAKQHRAK